MSGLNYSPRLLKETSKHISIAFIILVTPTVVIILVVSNTLMKADTLLSLTMSRRRLKTTAGSSCISSVSNKGSVSMINTPVYLGGTNIADGVECHIESPDRGILELRRNPGG